MGSENFRVIRRVAHGIVSCVTRVAHRVTRVARRVACRVARCIIVCAITNIIPGHKGELPVAYRGQHFTLS